MNKYIVTFAPPTPNGDLHVGHLSGPYLAADVYTRSRRLMGDDVLFVSYSDDYQSYLLKKSVETGSTPDAVCKKYYKKIVKSLESVNINTDSFISTINNQYFKDAVKLFYSSAVDNDMIDIGEFPVGYCSRCNVYGYESFGRAECNFCGSSSDLSQCENCAYPPDIEQVKEIKCSLCKNDMVMVKGHQEYIKIDQCYEYITELMAFNKTRKALSEFVRKITNSTIKKWPISRDNEYGVDGITMPENRRIHTWFSGIAGYYASSLALDTSVGKNTATNYWKDKNTTIACFVGYDCAFSHAIVYPSLLKNIDMFTNKIKIFTNYFLKLNGEDFSTSRGHAIWLSDIVKEVDPDFLRLYVAAYSPEEECDNFETLDLYRFLNVKIYPVLDSLISGVKINNVGHVDSNSVDILVKDIVDRYKDKWLFAIGPSTFSMKNIALIIIDVIKESNSDNNFNQNDLAFLLIFIAYISLPVMPVFSKKILLSFNVDEKELLNIFTNKNIDFKFIIDHKKLPKCTYIKKSYLDNICNITDSVLA